MLVRIQRGQRCTEGAKKGRQPQKFAREFLKLSNGACTGVHEQAQEGAQAGEFVWVKGDRHKVEVKGPANPYHGRTKGSFMPAHRYAQRKQKYHNEARQEWSGRPLEQRENVIHIH